GLSRHLQRDPVMATATATHAVSSTLPTANDPSGGSIWRSPLVPVALAATAGILLDRHAGIPLPLSLLLAMIGLAVWACTRNRPAPVPLACLGLTILALGAAYHHWRRDVYPENDIGNYAVAEARPVHLRGVLEEEPFRPPPEPDRALRTRPVSPSAVAVL